ncbi:hypothetical protein [Halobacteriovorax sp. HLS]|uniref:hypothetical protein n=1 Tax=Halobacteriovorax sp. HLS TaxID=2234000 RepID=UPI000FDB803E|nr:hypothetical protein [Halobacteriovorax sp. HLS]
MSEQTKIYKTSIVPENGHLVLARKNETIATSLQIEIVHIAIFALVLFCMFIGIWKAAGKAERDAENKASASGLNHK